MTDLSRRFRVRACWLLFAWVFGLGGGRVEAQMSYGFGLDGGIHPFYTPGFGPSPETQYLFDRSVSLSSHYDRLLREQGRRNSTNPNDYTHFVRDNSGGSSYNIRSQQRLNSTGTGSSSSTSPGSSSPSPVPYIDLGSFLGSDGHVDWPRDVPSSPDLAAKREAADEAIRVAVDQLKGGKVTIQSANVARARLIAFGQPALARVRAERSAPVADAFHHFLLGLLRAVEHSAPAEG